MLANSKVRKYKKSKIQKYEFIRGSFDSIVKRSLNDILKEFNVKITIKQSKDIESIMFNNKDNIIDDELSEAIINGLFDLTIHNDSQGRTINEEITLYVLCQAINSLNDKYIDKAYSFVKEHCKFSDNALMNLDKSIYRYSELKTSPFILIKIIKIHNELYYKEHIEKLLKDLILFQSKLIYEIILDLTILEQKRVREIMKQLMIFLEI